MLTHASRVLAARWLVVVMAIIAASVIAAATAASAPVSTKAQLAKQGGRYQVIVQGFVVNTQTKDHALEVDGKGDEVYINSRIVYTDRTKATLEGASAGLSVPSEVTTATMGDRNGYPQRVQAGSMPNCGVFGCGEPMGGLRTGDRFPENPLTADPGPALPIAPPFVLWEGDLVQGDHSLVIVPSIWEWDGGRDAYAGFVQWLQDAVKAIRDTASTATWGQAAKPVLDIGELVTNLAVGFRKVLGAAGDRPIGDQSTWAESSAGTTSFKPQVLELNYDTAEMLIHNSNTLGIPGLVAIHYVDNAELAGDYTLYLRVVRIGDAKLAPDTTAPTVKLMAPLRQTTGVLLRWTGTDPNIVGAQQSGIAAYDVRTRVDTNPYTVRRTTGTSLPVTLAKGHRVNYTVRARDHAGNIGRWTPLRSITR
jgi:hypothetical protein